MTTVGAAVHIHLEGTTQTRLVCGCVCGCVCVCVWVCVCVCVWGGTSEGRSGGSVHLHKILIENKTMMQNSVYKR